MSLYDNIIDYLNENISKKDNDLAHGVTKSKRPLKMPKNYDFSVRNVDWS